MHPLLRRPSPALLVACLALFVALGGPAQARKLINGKTIRAGTVSSKQLRNHGITVTDLSRKAVASLQRTPAGSIGTSQLADGAVGASQLRAGAVTAGALAANSLTGAAIADGSLGTPDLADGAITSEKIGSSQVKKADIGPGAVGQSELGTAAVTGTEVKDASLTAKDLAAFSGTLDLTAKAVSVAAGTCATISTDALPAVVAGATLTDDVVLVGRPQGWPAALTLSAQPKDGASLELTACNLGTVAAEAFATPVPFLAIQT
jgi:hypothetical protein